MNRQFLQSQISSITSKRNQLDWLAAYPTQAEKVANFGCHIGGETLALMWLLDAQEAVGLDIEADSISQAQDTLGYLRENIEQTRRTIQFNLKGVSEEDRVWWSGLPYFFTHRVLEDDFSLEYRICDITQPTDLPNNYFDLAFCDFVLHHIWYDEMRENAGQDTKFTVNEMARVIKPGGIVAARELIQFDDKPRLDFTGLLERAGVERVDVQEEEFKSLERYGWVGKYIYRKIASSGD